MFKKILASVFTVTGSRRGDVMLGTRAMINRAVIGFNISNDEAFRTLARSALAFHELLNDQQNVLDAQVPTIVERLKNLTLDQQVMESSHGLRERITSAMSAVDPIGTPAEDDAGRFIQWIKRVAIANDAKRSLWSDAEVLFAQRWFGIDGPPTIERMREKHGEELIDSILERVIKAKVSSQQMHDALLGNGSPCHVCAGADDLSYHDFALRRNIAKTRNWNTSLASLAISAVTIPLLGGGLLRGPETTLESQTLRLRLVLCKSCVSSRQTGRDRKLRISQEDYERHPLWKAVHDAGFDESV